MKTVFRRYLSVFSLITFTSPTWAVGDIDIYLEDARNVQCSVLRVTVPHCSPGKDLEQGRPFYNRLSGTDSVISLSGGMQDDHLVHIISKEKAHQDDEGLFLNYRVSRLQGDTLTGTPFILDIRQMPFSREVFTLGTVFKTIDIWREVGNLDVSGWEKLYVFPKMNEEQYNRINLNRHMNFNDILNGAFFTQTEYADNIICFCSDGNMQDLCSSQLLGIIAHETGHYVLKNVAPKIARSTSEFALAFNESFADCTSYFLLMQFSQIRDEIYFSSQGDLGPSFDLLIEMLLGDANGPVSTGLLDPPAGVHHLSERLTRVFFNALLKSVSQYGGEREDFTQNLLQETNSLMQIYLQATINYEGVFENDFSISRFGNIMCQKALEKENYALLEFILQSFREEGINLNLGTLNDQNDNDSNVSPFYCAMLRMRPNMPQRVGQAFPVIPVNDQTINLNPSVLENPPVPNPQVFNIKQIAVQSPQEKVGNYIDQLRMRGYTQPEIIGILSPGTNPGTNATNILGAIRNGTRQDGSWHTYIQNYEQWERLTQTI